MANTTTNTTTNTHVKSSNVDNDPEHSYFVNHGLNTHRATRNDIKPNNNTFDLEGPDVNGLAMTSTNIFVYSNDEIVGMIQSFSVKESRTIDKLNAIGVEGVIQAVPQNSNGGTLDVTRIALYSSNLWASLGLTTTGNGYDAAGSKTYRGNTDANWDKASYKINNGDSGKTISNGSKILFKTLKDQRVPLEIKVKIPMSGTDANAWYTETYIDCWLSSYSKSYDVGKITVAEQCSIDYADVY